MINTNHRIAFMIINHQSGSLSILTAPQGVLKATTIENA